MASKAISVRPPYHHIDYHEITPDKPCQVKAASIAALSYSLECQFSIDSLGFRLGKYCAIVDSFVARILCCAGVVKSTTPW